MYRCIVKVQSPVTSPSSCQQQRVSQHLKQQFILSVGLTRGRGNPRSERSVTIISCHIVKFELAGKSGTCGADSGPDITRYIDCTSAGLAASAVVTWWKLPTMACITLFRRKEDGYKVIK